MCRLCYTDVAKAREAGGGLPAGLHVIMCDTRRPPAAAECDDMCALKKNTVRTPRVQYFGSLLRVCLFELVYTVPARSQEAQPSELPETGPPWRVLHLILYNYIKKR